MDKIKQKLRRFTGGSSGPGKRLLAGYMALLMVFTTYFALDTFVITRVYGDADSAAGQSGEVQMQDDSAGSSDNSGLTDGDNSAG